MGLGEGGAVLVFDCVCNYPLCLETVSPTHNLSIYHVIVTKNPALQSLSTV